MKYMRLMLDTEYDAIRAIRVQGIPDVKKHTFWSMTLKFSNGAYISDYGR